MATVYRILVEFCWAAGLLSLLLAVVLKFLLSGAEVVKVNAQGALIFAGVLFLCTLATREMEARTK